MFDTQKLLTNSATEDLYQAQPKRLTHSENGPFVAVTPTLSFTFHGPPSSQLLCLFFHQKLGNGYQY